MAILKDLIVHGSSRFLNKIYASEIQTPLIDAEAGIFKKLKADDATIVGLLDVQGQMHTNSWTNSNIATIDESFYITPTLSSSSGTVSFSSATAATFTGSYAAVSSLYIGNDTANTVQWTSGSKILITGEVEVDGEWTPLGTLLGTLNSTNPTTSMPIVNITDNRNNTSNILTNIYSLKSNDSLSYRNLKISLYQRADNSEYYPLGIFMTALGQNGKTFLDIYGGVNELTTSYGGYANPNVRIGNLSGLPAITTSAGNFSPVGWGIYTTNGYFSGTIVSNTGVIGGWKLGASSLYNGTTGLNNNTEGIYLGTDGIRNYLTSTQYVNITGGKITAQGVDLTGEITASSGLIGGWNIGTDTNKSLYYGNQTPGATTTNLILSPTSATNSNAIGGSSTGLTWFISAGKVFGVTTAGALYCNDAHISGEITATSGTIGGIKLDDSGKLWITDANISGTISASHIDVSSISIGSLNGANNYAQKTDVTQAIDNVSTIANTALGQSVWYAECSTTAGTAVKVATISPVTTNFVLTNGITVNVKFVNTNSASGSSLQLNVNETGAKNIKYIYNGTYNSIQADYLRANQMYQFRYDGIYWIVQMMYDINYYDRSLYAVALQASKAIPSARIAVLGLDGKLHLLNSSSFRISCPLLYVGNAYSADNVTNSFSRATNYTYWGTPFNLTNTHSIQNATANTNVYVVGTLSGDIFTPNTTVLTCVEPTTEDGLYYMLLGRMTSTTYAILQAEHPIYIYKNGKFQKLEATTATSYITYIDANNGIKIHNESDMLNYLQLNSTAISIYRNNIETLNISNNEIRIGKFSDNNVYIDSDSIDIRNGTTTLASFTGDNTKFYDPVYNKELATFGASGAIIGANNEQRFVIEKDGIKSINDSGATVFSVNSTEGTVVTEAEVAPSGETDVWSSTSITLDTVGSGFSVDVTFYNKSMTARFEISHCNSNLTNVKVNSVSSSAILISTGGIFGLNSGTYSIALPPFTFTHGTAQTTTYTITASFVNTFGDSYDLTAVETVAYDGAITITLSSFDGECVRTSGNNEEESMFLGLWSKVVYGEIYQSSAYTKAPAMTFGTRGKNAILAPFSVTIGEDLYANNDNQLSIGRYNLNNDEFFPLAFAIGNGVNDTDRSNAFNVDWDGNTEIAGKAEIGSNLIVKGNQVINGNLAIDGFMTVSSNTYSTIKYLNVGYLTVSTRKPFSLVQKTYTRTITANSACYISQKYTSPTGYIPIGIIDWGIFNGTYADYCIMGHAYIWRGNPNTIDIYVWNQHPSASATNVVIYVNILCIANTFL